MTARVADAEHVAQDPDQGAGGGGEPKGGREGEGAGAGPVEEQEGGGAAGDGPRHHPPDVHVPVQDARGGDQGGPDRREPRQAGGDGREAGGRSHSVAPASALLVPSASSSRPRGTSTLLSRSRAASCAGERLRCRWSARAAMVASWNRVRWVDMYGGTRKGKAARGWVAGAGTATPEAWGPGPAREVGYGRVSRKPAQSARGVRPLTPCGQALCLSSLPRVRTLGARFSLNWRPFGPK